MGYEEPEIIAAIESELCPISVVLSSETTQVYPGENFQFQVTLKNWGAVPLTFQGWIDGILPSHNPAPINPILGPVNVTLQPGQQIIKNVAVGIPLSAPPNENYRLKCSVGMAPDNIQNCDLLRFDILSP
jgi:hypothetical protein